jgi:CRISPR-associated protein Cas1
MLKRTIHISKPSRVSVTLGQLMLAQKDDNGVQREVSLPIEDLWAVILESRQITITQAAMADLLERNVALVTCDEKHLPTGLLLNLAGNSVQAERYRYQVDATLPLKKQLWQQTVKAKITNQAALLNTNEGHHLYLQKLIGDVKSGDSTNREGVAAAYYWPRVFQKLPGFSRDGGHRFTNALLNYGYAIVRAMIARSLVGTGLMPTLGIHHRNRYNHFCLADDIMEPYRPFVDFVVKEVVDSLDEWPEELSKAHKTELLKLPVMDVSMNGSVRPMLVATNETSVSLFKCFSGESRKISYPSFLA